MKLTMIIISVSIVLFTLFQIYTYMSSGKTTAQVYKVIRVEKEFEIRYYPSVTMATISSSALSYKELGSSGFRKLAAYIFGGNEDGKQIAMTAPVHMEVNDSLSSMSFVMPPEYNEGNLPKPNDAGVSIATTADEYVAAISFGGFASDKDISKHSEKLAAALKKNGITYYGHFRYLGYNPPYQLFGRKNEIIISINHGQQ